MNKTTYASLVVALIIVFVIFLLFSTRAMSGGMMNDGTNGIGWGGHGWIWITSIISLFIGIGIRWILFKKTG